MARGLQETLLALLADRTDAVAQADLAQAAALSRQELSFRQRAGAAAAQLRQARADGADPAAIAALEAEVQRRSARLEAASVQARAAEIKRPTPEGRLAQVFGRAAGKVETPPLTAAILSAEGEVLARAVALDTGVFHLTHPGDLKAVTVQLSDGAGRVLYREPQPLDIPAGAVVYLDVALDTPKPDPGPVPTHPVMPALVGQSEGVALELLRRIGQAEPTITDDFSDGQAGIVIAQDPKAGTLLGPDSQISLTVRRSRRDDAPPKVLPGFIGGTLAEAEARLKALRLRPEVIRRPDDGPADIVLDQAPKEGTPLADIATVTLTVSAPREAPPETVIVPDLIGRTAKLARELLKAVELTPEVKDTADPEAPAEVIAQDPKAGTTVRRGATVSITVNTAPEPGRVVPNLKGRDLREAWRVLAALELTAEVSTVPDGAPEGQVIAQDPKANTRVEAGSTVVLKVSGRGRARGAARDLNALTRAMARDPRAETAGLDAARLAAALAAGGAEDLDAARELAALAPEALRDRLKLRNKTAAGTFRAILRRALKALG
jgi:beta-lactam-binding protein with PASTA domain